MALQSTRLVYTSIRMWCEQMMVEACECGMNGLGFRVQACACEVSGSSAREF